MRIYGWDASHYDAVPSGAQVVAEGIAFMTHKAGGDANDAELAAWWSALKGHRDEILLGAYWVLHRTDGLMAADAFLARLDSQCPGWRDGPFILQVDCETWNNGATPAPTKGQIKACADRLAAKAPKLRPIVYAPQWVYGDSLTGLGYPLWASSYVSGTGTAAKLYPGDSSSRWAAYSGQTPAILQFSSSATIVGQTTCDANAYRGTLAQLTALAAPGWEQEVTKDEIAAIAQAVASKLHLDNTTPASGLAKDQAASEQRVIKAISAEVAAAAGKQVDPAAIVAGVLAGLDPAAIAAAIPDDLAASVADILAQRAYILVQRPAQ